MKLVQNRRIKKEERETHELTQRVRFGETTEEDIDRLMSLHLEEMKDKHGMAIVDEILKKSIYLYAFNKDIHAENIAQICHIATEENPIAIVQTKSKGVKTGKAIKSHFPSGDNTSESSLLC